MFCRLWVRIFAVISVCCGGCCLSSLGCPVVRKQLYFWTVNSQKFENYGLGTQDACAIGSVTNRDHEPMVEFALKAESALGHENGQLVGRLRELWFRYQYRPCGLWCLPIFLINGDRVQARLTTYCHPEPKLRMHGAVPPLPHTPV
jgi:hypothetical protein